MDAATGRRYEQVLEVLLLMKRDDRVDERGPARRQVTRENRHDPYQGDRRGEGTHIGGRQPERTAATRCPAAPAEASPRTTPRPSVSDSPSSVRPR